MATGEDSVDVYDHGTVVRNNNKRPRVKCNYCGKDVNSSTRLKCHLGGIGTDVVHCVKVPENVKKSFGNFHWKRNCSPTSNGFKHIKLEDGQTPDSVLHDGMMENIKFFNRRPDARLAVDGEEEKEDASSRHAKRCIGRFLYETGIDLSNVKSLSFKRMLNSTLGDCPVKIPTLQELKGWILRNEMREMQEHVKNIRRSWESSGCSVLLDGWINEKGQNLVSFVVECPEGPVYLRSADVSAIQNDGNALQLLLDRVIEEVGVDNAVQIIACSTVGWVGTVGKQFMNRHKMVFWSISASHCIKLMLEKIGNLDCIKGIIDKAKTITKFIYENEEVLQLMRNHTNSYDLIKPSKMKFATPFLTLENMISQEKNLKDMFASSEWRTSVWSFSPEGKKVANLIQDLSFWTGAVMTVNAAIPLLRLIIEPDKPQVGYIYETMDQTKETIKEQLKNKKSQYIPFWKIIDEIWNTYLHSPLHAAGYYLNPSLFYSTDFYSDAEVSFGLLCCIVRMVKDQQTQDLISLQLDDYRHARGSFKEGSAIDKRANVLPAQWWSTYGKQHPELQKFAIRILSQSCDGAMRYGLKRGLAEKLLLNGRNHVEQQQLDDLTYVHYNLHLQNTLESGLQAEEIDPMDDWIVNRTLEITPKIGGLEWMEADCAAESNDSLYKPSEFQIKEDPRFGALTHLPDAYVHYWGPSDYTSRVIPFTPSLPVSFAPPECTHISRCQAEYLTNLVLALKAYLVEAGNEWRVPYMELKHELEQVRARLAAANLRQGDCEDGKAQSGTGSDDEMTTSDSVS